MSVHCSTTHESFGRYCTAFDRFSSNTAWSFSVDAIWASPLYASPLAGLSSRAFDRLFRASSRRFSRMHTLPSSTHPSLKLGYFTRAWSSSSWAFW